MIHYLQTVFINSVPDSFASLSGGWEQMVILAFALEHFSDEQVKTAFIFSCASMPATHASFNSSVKRFKEWYLVLSRLEVVRYCQFRHYS
jgi:hypothetical protein